MNFIIKKNNSDEVKAKLAQAIEQGLLAVGLSAEGHAKDYCPVDTGRLRNSISNGMIDDNSVAIGTNVEYAPYVELGTSKSASQPYLQPAIKSHQGEYKDLIKEALKNA